MLRGRRSVPRALKKSTRPSIVRLSVSCSPYASVRVSLWDKECKGGVDIGTVAFEGSSNIHSSLFVLDSEVMDFGKSGPPSDGLAVD